jgi:hypothetical protein
MAVKTRRGDRTSADPRPRVPHQPSSPGSQNLILPRPNRGQLAYWTKFAAKKASFTALPSIRGWPKF